jgi:hypothetical protein
LIDAEVLKQCISSDASSLLAAPAFSPRIFAINILGLAKRVRAKVLQASTSEIYGDPEELSIRELASLVIDVRGSRSRIINRTALADDSSADRIFRKQPIYWRSPLKARLRVFVKDGNSTSRCTSDLKPLSRRLS